VQVLQDSRPRNLGLRNPIPAFLLGFLATSFQIYLLREFCVHFYGNEMSFGFVLAAWLLWGGVGSLAASRFHLRLGPNRLFPAYLSMLFVFPLSLVVLRFSRFLLGILPGEVTGIVPILGFSLALTLFVSLPLGAMFVFNSQFLRGDVARVYLVESLGAAAGGLLVYLLLIPFFSNWQGAGIMGMIALGLAFFSLARKKDLPLASAALIFLAGFAVLDLPSQRFYWRPFTLVDSEDTQYGKLQVIKTSEQISLYNNSLLVYSSPDPAAAEEAVHFAFLQNSQAQRALLIGGGAGGALRECLKYPQTTVDYVELDPETIALSRKFLSGQEIEVLESPRVHILYQDGRRFLQGTKNFYDLIILSLPEPATAQINRFYTREFFLEARTRLNRGGVFSFRVPSAENYLSLELRQFLASLYFTLREAFPVVKVVPGDTNVYLASEGDLTIDPDELSRRIERLGLHNTYVNPQMLFARLNPLRIERLRSQLEEGPRRLNLDLVPISYYDNSVLWSTQFKSGESAVLRFLAGLSPFWLLDFPLLLILLVLVVFLLKPTPTSRYSVPLTIMGLTTITVEICVLISFQTFYGYVYGKIALLMTAFMAGLFLGALLSYKRRRPSYSHLLLIQLGFIPLLILFQQSLRLRPPEVFMFAFLLALGFLGGNLFVTANALLLSEKTNLGLGYGLDLLGSFGGALAAAAFIIPLTGLVPLLNHLWLLNSFCFLFLVVRRPR